MLAQEGENMKSKKEETEDNGEELIKLIKDLGVSLGPLLLKNKELDAPIIKRQQWMNFIIMITICAGVIILAYDKVIDGSAATGLIGAVIGYIFGHIYSKSER